MPSVQRTCRSQTPSPPWSARPCLQSARHNHKQMVRERVQCGNGFHRAHISSRTRSSQSSNAIDSVGRRSSPMTGRSFRTSHGRRPTETVLEVRLSSSKTEPGVAHGASSPRVSLADMTPEQGSARLELWPSRGETDDSQVWQLATTVIETATANLRGGSAIPVCPESLTPLSSSHKPRLVR